MGNGELAGVAGVGELRANGGVKVLVAPPVSSLSEAVILFKQLKERYIVQNNKLGYDYLMRYCSTMVIKPNLDYFVRESDII